MNLNEMIYQWNKTNAHLEDRLSEALHFARGLEQELAISRDMCSMTSFEIARQYVRDAANSNRLTVSLEEAKEMGLLDGFA